MKCSLELTGIRIYAIRDSVDDAGAVRDWLSQKEGGEGTELSHEREGSRGGAISRVTTAACLAGSTERAGEGTFKLVSEDAVQNAGPSQRARSSEGRATCQAKLVRRKRHHNTHRGRF